MNTEDKMLDFSLLVKPTSQDVFLDYTSAHPRRTILNSAKNKIRRAINNSSTPKLQDISIKRIADIMLKKNSFSPNIVQKLIQETKNTQDKQNCLKRTLKLLTYHCLILMNKRVEKSIIH